MTIQSAQLFTQVNPNNLLSISLTAGEYFIFISDGTVYTGTGGNPSSNVAGTYMKMSSTGALSALIPPAVTTEDIQDAVGAFLTDTGVIDFTYDDAGNLETATVKANSITDAMLVDVPQATLKGRAAGAGTGSPQPLTRAQVLTILALSSTDLSDFSEASQDIIGALLTDSNTIDYTYDDAGNAETVEYRIPIISVTGASRVYTAADHGKYFRRSNGGAAMTDTLPTTPRDGYFQKTQNLGTTPSETITFSCGPGATIGELGATTYVLKYGCRQTFVFDAASNRWSFDAGNGNLVKTYTGAVAGDLVTFADSAGINLVKATKAMTKLANSFDLVADYSADKTAVADAVTAITAAQAATAAGGRIYVPTGRFRVGSNLTITSPVEFASGGRFVVSTGVTLTINAPILADLEWIFECEGTGTVVLSADYNVERYPEWWGGVVGADCSPAFAQCVKAGTITLLQARDYVTSATLAIPAYATVLGQGYSWEGTNTATRILLASASVSPIVQLGSTATPVDLNSAPAAPAIYDCYVTRNQAPNANTVGVLIAWSRFARCERVRSNTNITGFKIINAISPFIVDTFSKRDIAIAAGQGADSFFGYDIDGTGALPAAGGNASVWLSRPQTELNVTIANSTGYYVHGRYTDTFITQPETLGTNYGIDILGDRGGAGQTVGSNANLVIQQPVVDQTKTLGIRVQNVNQWGSVRIVQPYCGPSTGDGVTATNCDGTVSIIGGEMRMNVSTTGKGITFDGCRSPRLDGTIIAECTTQALVLNNTAGGQFTPMIQNVTATLSAGVQAVATVTKTQIRPSINGGASKVSIGYQSLAASNDRNSLVTTGLVDGVVVTPISLAVGAEKNSGFPDLVVQSSLSAASAAIINAEQVAGQLILPANTLLPGTTIRVRATGQYSQTGVAAVANVQRLRLGPLGTTADPILIPISTTSNAAASTKIPFTIEFTLTCRSIGAAGSIVGFLIFQNAAVTGIANTLTPIILPTGAAPAANNGLLTFNTTVLNYLSLTAISGAATSNITYEVAVLFIEKV